MLPVPKLNSDRITFYVPEGIKAQMETFITSNGASFSFTTFFAEIAIASLKTEQGPLDVIEAVRGCGKINTQLKDQLDRIEALLVSGSQKKLHIVPNVDTTAKPTRLSSSGVPLNEMFSSH